MTDIAPGRVTLRTPTDVLAAVPYLLGFHPTDSVVVLGLHGARLVFAVRADVPGRGGGRGGKSWDDPASVVGDVADQVGAVVAAHSASRALVVGYGTADLVTPAVMAVCEALTRNGVDAGEALRAAGGRYWPYRCPAPGCCPAEGTPYDTTGTEIAAAATYGGRVVLPDRASLRRSVEPVGGAELAAAEQATRSAVAALAGVPDRFALRRVGVRALVDALDRYRTGGRLTDDEVARLAVLVGVDEVRDAASTRILYAGSGGSGSGPEPDLDLEPDLELWRDVVRRTRPDLVAPPATLLALAAWRLGDGALAWVAVERALATDSGYPLARLIAEALERGLRPGGSHRFDVEPGQSRRTR